VFTETGKIQGTEALYMKKGNLMILLAAAVVFAGCGKGRLLPVQEEAGRTVEEAGRESGTQTDRAGSGTGEEVPEKTAAQNAAGGTGTVAGREAAGAPEYEWTGVPDYDGTLSQYIVNNNVPLFTEEEIREAAKSYEYYAPLDAYGRTTYAVASVGKDLMPRQRRGDIHTIHPVGWWSMKNSGISPERCHMIAYQLSGENDRDTNLMTGTHQLNVTGGMLEYENRVADYVHQTGNHVLYRVTCDFRENEDLARGVLMEARSIEDGGTGVSFCVYIYNAESGWTIDYMIASAEPSDTLAPAEQNGGGKEEAGRGSTENPSGKNSAGYVLNTSSMKIHLPSCDSLETMADHNRQESSLSLQELEAQGYTPCRNCIG
jgi:DNA-entry nuclease